MGHVAIRGFWAGVLFVVLAGAACDKGSTPVCGDGVVEGFEQCDGSALGESTCQSAASLAMGTLRCTAECTLDASGCFSCGNGSIEGPEICDGSNVSGETCWTMAGQQHGALTCAGDCLSYDTSACHSCGDGTISGAEVCDGANLAGQDCQTTTGHTFGDVFCSQDCLTFDTSTCHSCGNNFLDSGEACDGTELGGRTCQSVTGHSQGQLVCSADCQEVESSACHTCGDSNIHGPEQCDLANLAGATCESLGHDGGVLVCNMECVLDDSGCVGCGVGMCDGITCSYHGQCIIDACQPMCQCDPGFQAVGLTCLDPAACQSLCDGETCSGHGGCYVSDCVPECSCEPPYVPGPNLTCIDTNSCTGVTCSGHGFCQMVGGVATCVCEPGYEPDGLTCVESPLARLGELCADSAECASGWCLMFSGDDLGYCSMRDCVDSAECINYSSDGAEMCCVDVGGDFFICEKIVPGYACGTQDGMCGTPCAGQIDSACHPSQACLMDGMGDPNAVCAHECSSDADCFDCFDPVDPSTTFACTPISGGVTYCMVDATPGCSSPADCPAGEACIPFVGANGVSIEPQCGAFGTVDTGGVCIEGADPPECIGAYCFGGHCSESCVFDVDCPGDMVCGTLIFCTNPPTCSETTDPTGACYWKEGSMAPCDGDGDCPTGEFCDFYREFGSGSVQKICLTRECDPAAPGCGWVGEDCSADPCYNGLCLSAGGEQFCSAACDIPSDCPPGFSCGSLDLGDGTTTGVCVPDSSCSSGDDCPVGEYCGPVLVTPDTLGGQCRDGTGASGAIGDSCTDSLDCDSDWCIDGSCTEVCAVDANCPGGVCAQILFGLPDGATDSIGMCKWLPGSNNPCAGNGDCPSGEYCDYYLAVDDTVAKLCVAENCDPAAGPPDCAPLLDNCDAAECWGDLCLTPGGGGSSWCSALCEGSSDCPPGSVCGTMGVGADQTVGVCILFDGSAAACTVHYDCPMGEVCNLLTGFTGPETVCGTQIGGGVGPGEACGSPSPVCENNLCLTSGYCSAVCVTNADCAGYTTPAGQLMECSYIGVGDDYATACVEVGTESPLCSLCSTHVDCAGDAMCIVPTPAGEATFCSLPCPIGDECPTETTCGPHGGAVDQCVPDSGSCLQ